MPYPHPVGFQITSAPPRWKTRLIRLVRMLKHAFRPNDRYFDDCY